MKISGVYVGKWRIIQMDQWDQDFVDLVVPGHITIHEDGTGSFQFGVVEAVMDCQLKKAGAKDQLEFTWYGFDEGDSVNGRGWVQVHGRSMSGHLFFHLGDDSGFRARKGE